MISLYSSQLFLFAQISFDLIEVFVRLVGPVVPRVVGSRFLKKQRMARLSSLNYFSYSIINKNGVIFFTFVFRQK